MSYEDYMGKIDKVFPFSSYREGQKEAIADFLQAWDDGKKHVIFEGPCGCGKSVIAYTIAQFFDRVFWVCPQKFLQDQIMQDFGSMGVIDLKGRSNYPCEYFDIVLNKLSPTDTQAAIDRMSKDSHKGWVVQPPNGRDCSAGVCRLRDDASKCAECFSPGGTFCPYWRRLREAQESHICLMNFKSFLFQTTMAERFGPRDLIILDECLHPHTHIMTDIGKIPIGKLVNHKIDCNVLSYNKKTSQLEYKKIIRYIKNRKKMTYKVLVGNMVLYPTIDHKIFTPDGKKKLSELKIGSMVYTNNTEVTPTQRQVLLGSLLGDSCAHVIRYHSKYKYNLYKGIKARVRYRHGLIQSEYIDWKYHLLQEHVNTAPKVVKNRGFGEYSKTFSTKCNLYREIKDAIIDGKKIVNNKWLDNLDELGIAIWFMDDGSNSSDVIYFHTEGFTYSENTKIRDWLIKKYNLPARILKYRTQKGKRVYYISIGRDGGKILASLIAKYIHPSMRYKLPSGDWPQFDDSINNIRSSPISAQPILLLEEYKETITYDLEIEDNHNYFAGSTLVSNCHTAESEILDFVSMAIKDLPFKHRGISIPKMTCVEDYIEHFKNINIVGIISEFANIAKYNGNYREEDEWHDLSRKMEGLIMRGSNKTWVFEHTELGTVNQVKFKPIFVNDIAYHLLFKHAQRSLMMSATILDPKHIQGPLGLDKDDVFTHRMKSRFPKENRPIYFTPSGSMNYRSKSRTYPVLVRDVDSICNTYPDKRGMIHTHNFEIADLLIDSCNSANRFLYQKDFRTKNEMLKEHAQRNNSIIVAPAMHEGLDLKDDLARFQLLVKVPYPNFMDNAQLKLRMEMDDDYYEWLTALKLTQCLGRVVRSETDHADTYIMDEEFKRFYNRAQKMIPKWVKEAIIWS